MGKNIVLCSDGTGNKGGTGFDTNVFKLYHAIKLDLHKHEQIAFYDNGVGTAKHAVARVIGGVAGFGFRQNVQDLYEFAGRHYVDGDHIYGFGFSRGAATIRAFAGMVEHCGLVLRHTGYFDDNGDEVVLEEDDFQQQIKAAMAHYVNRRHGFSLSGPWHACVPWVRAVLATYKGQKNSLMGWKSRFFIGRFWRAVTKPEPGFIKQEVSIEFLGLWDTVAALGLPQLGIIDRVLNILRRHKFYDFEPENTVNNVFQAIAVDDERRTFWPLIWDENKFKGRIEQVWFPGVHSNVGGGYPRAGLANITLDWMIQCLEGHRQSLGVGHSGLILKDGFAADVHDSIDFYGKMYDSRAGLALLYRFQPRPIARWRDKMPSGDVVRIHESVLLRMSLRTAGYGPGQLPIRFDVVDSHVTYDTAKKTLDSRIVDAVNFSAPKKTNAKWSNIRKNIDITMGLRISLYWWFLAASLALLLASLYFRIFGPGARPGASETEDAWPNTDGVHGLLGYAVDFVNWLFAAVADILNFILPDFFDNLVIYGLLNQPWWSVGLALAAAVYYWLRGQFKKWSDAACEKARCFILRHMKRPY